MLLYRYLVTVLYRAGVRVESKGLGFRVRVEGKG